MDNFTGVGYNILIKRGSLKGGVHGMNNRVDRKSVV